MDTKRLIVTMLISLAVIMGWQLLVAQWYARHPEAIQRPPTTEPTTQPAIAAATGPATRQATTGAVPQMVAAAPTTAPTLAPAATTTAPSVVRLGESDAFPLQLEVTTRGGAIESATLKRFKATDGKSRYAFQSAYDPSDASTFALATRTIYLDGAPIDTSSARWTIAERTDRRAHLTLDILREGKAVARLHKVYELSEGSSPNLGYEVVANHSFENLTDSPLRIRAFFNGPNTPPREIERGMDQQVVGGYNDEGVVALHTHLVESFDAKTTSRDLLSAGGKQSMLWAGSFSVYFNAILRTTALNDKLPTGEYLAAVNVEALNPSSEPHLRQVRLTVETKELVLAPREATAINGAVYLGPKWRGVLDKPYYTQFPRAYDKTLVIVSGPCAFCTFSWLINILVWILAAFHAILRDWGLAIIALVIVVRAILHPITKRSQISMAKMQKMGPEIERLKKKYGDNKDELNKAMWEFQKEQGMTPILGCLPLFLQMPIWIALWSALQSTFELRQAPFLYGLFGPWMSDLAKPDHLIKFAKPIPLFLFGWHLEAINLLPLVMIVVTWINFKFQPRPAAMTPEQEQQQKMMQWMSLLIPLMFYAMPSGLNLYYVTSMGLGIIESKIIRDHLKQQEEAEKAGRVIVDAGPTRSGKRKERPEPPKRGWLAGLLANLQEKAEQVRRESDKRKR